MIPRSQFGNALWVGANLPGALRFLGALDRVQEYQARLLKRTLAENRETEYGRDFGFAGIRDAEDYRARVPLTVYDDYRERVARISRGIPGVLTREPVKLFEPSSGSTAAAKWIPYTATLQAQIRAAVAPWMADLYWNWPSLLGGPCYWSITPVARHPGAEDTVVPVGFSEDSAYLGGGFQRLVDQVLAVPSQVGRVQDIELFRSLTLLYLLRQRELRFLSVWHPSFLHLLLDHLVTHWEDLRTRLAVGVQIPELGLELPPDPIRAGEIDQVGPDRPGDLWPRLRVLSCWGDGHARGPAEELRERLGGVILQPKGLLATEAFVTIPYQGQQVLAVTSHFFEFLDHQGRSFLAHEVQAGGRYSVVVTTGGGLYRYRLQDLVEVRGFLKGTPCLSFLGKEDRVSDLRGEKLADGFVGVCLERVLKNLGLRPSFAMLAPETHEAPPHYQLYLEARGVPPRNLAGEFENALRENPHYDYCRRLGQLGPVRLERLRAGAFERFSQRMVQRGQRLGDIKPTPLSPLGDWREWLR